MGYDDDEEKFGMDIFEEEARDETTGESKVALVNHANCSSNHVVKARLAVVKGG